MFQAEVTHLDELDIYIHPDGIIPTILFLRDHHNAQFLNVTDITAVDIPSRPYRFEVCLKYAAVCSSFHTAFTLARHENDKISTHPAYHWAW